MFIHMVNIGSTLALDLNRFQMKGKSNIIYRLLSLASVCMGMLAAVSCVQMEIEEYPEIGEGVSDVRFDVEFRPLDSVDPATRTAGDAVKHINSVHVVVYKTDGTLFHNKSFADVNTSEQNTSGITLTPPDGSSGFAEATYCRASFDLQLPLGEYRIYAIANYTPTEAQMASEEALKAISFTWNTNVAKNNAMFGYFTNGDQSVPSYDSSKPAGNRFAAPTIRIDRSNLTLHAWVRRIVSKVTVGFDGSDLNENVYIYIHSVQIKDIPSSVSLGLDNKPSSGMIANGEKVLYRPSSSAVNTAGLRVTKGVPTGISMGGTNAEGTIMDNSSNSGGVHHEASSNSLFLFENLQGNTATLKGKWQDSGDSFDSDGNITGSQDGAIDHPDGGTSGTIDFKDGVANGSYIEVKAYYVNKTSTNASQGEIVYRFMLGKDVDRNCDVERSNHYKVTLRFIKDANNVDWHISYTPENPEISVPSPMYISYLHGEKLDIPVVVRGARVLNFKAQIIENNWFYEGHPAIHTDNNLIYNGFLSFVKPDVNGNIAGTATWRKSDFEATDESTDSKVPAFKVTSPEGKQEYHYTVPVWTRHLQQGQGFSGNNAYIHKERTAKVKFTAVVEDAKGEQKTIEETITVIQVKRVVNPAGVWRPANSTKEFHIVQMESDAVSTATNATPDQAVSFRPTVSDGPWAAEIIEGADWVRISKTNGNYNNTKLEGSTGTHVDFYYKPSSVNSTGETRCGVIRITYHNNTCVHYVFVSHGLSPVAMGSTKTKWHMTNLHCQGKEEATPLHEGSMFRYKNTYAAILAENNYRPDIKTGYGYGPFKPIANYSYTTETGAYWTKEDTGGTVAGAREWPLSNDGYPTSTGSLEDEYTLRINRDDYNFTNAISNASIATAAQWNELVDLERYFGVLYGENSTETKTTADDAYEFPFVGVDGSHTNRNSIPYNYDKGMRGMFVWDRAGLAGRSSAIGNGHVFFPIGATGHGHRLHFPDWNSSDNTAIQPYEKIGELKYATMSEPLGDTKRPLLDDLYLSPGAIYWCKNWINNTNSVDDEPGYTQYGQNAQDINYHTYDFNTYSEYATWRRPTSNGKGSKGNLTSYYYNGTTYYNISSDSGTYDYTQGSDACFIRCVEP